MGGARAKGLEGVIGTETTKGQFTAGSFHEAMVVASWLLEDGLLRLSSDMNERHEHISKQDCIV